MNTQNTQKFSLRKLLYSAVCLALCLLLPFLTGQIPQVGKALSPMHIPVLLGGFLCGPWWAALVGLIAPVLRFLLFGSPPLFPMATAMSFELAAYGLAAGLLYRLFPHRVGGVYGALVGAMLIGRVSFGIAMFLLLGGSYTWEAFVSGAFVTALPGIILHLLLIPPIVLALQKAGKL